MEVEQSHNVLSERSSSKEGDDMGKLKSEGLNTSEADRVAFSSDTKIKGPGI